MSDELRDEFVERLTAAGGRVVRASPESVVEAVADVATPGLPVALTPELSDLAEALRGLGVDAFVAASGDRGGIEGPLRRAGTGVTACLAAIARSGSVIVGTGGGNGGLLAALPPRHVAVLRAEDIRADLSAALALALGGPSGGGRPGLTVITGPSRTADIELTPVVGVHGPLALAVVLVA